jgi:outer membrane murein-binding lipoprotein Lpp
MRRRHFGPTSRVNLGLTILLAATLASLYQGYNVNTRANSIAGAVVDLSASVRSLSATVETLNQSVLDCVNEGGECKAKSDRQTAAAVENIVDTLHADLDATLAQLENDLEKLRQDREIAPTPLPPVVLRVPTPAPPAQVVTLPAPSTLCLPLAVVTVGCGP